MKKRIVFIALFTQIILASFVFAQTSQITNGLNYLSSTQNEEGFWTSENELTLTTAEAIKTLRLLNQANTSTYTLALTWLQNQQLETTNNLAERIYILAAGGADSSLLVSYMYAALRAWGGYNDFTVNNLDTALALQALRAINYADQTVMQAAINYLLTNQNTDGGWGFYKDDTSNVYMTAIVSRALQHFSQTTAIANAVGKASSFIISNQNSGGGFGSSSPTVYETALAYIALVGVTTDNTVLGNAAQFITNAQLPNGSWNDDPYTTALALQALYFSVNKPPPPTPAAATITGAVINASTKQTLKGVAVVLQSNTAINTTTDATGKFTLTNVPKGAQQISFSLAGYATATASVNATEGALINLGNIPLSVNASAGIIQGTVTDAANGQPLAGATIAVSGAYTGTTTTGADGKFIFIDVPPGSVTIVASMSGYFSISGMGNLLAGGILFFNPQLSTEPPTVSTGTLTGKIVDAATNNPIQGVSVYLSGGASAVSDAQGVFNIEGINAGAFQLTISAAGYITQDYQVIITEGVTIDMGTIYLIAGDASTTTITGKVTDAATGNPIALADIMIAGTSLTTKTATDGSYSISGIEQLEFSIRAGANGYDSKTIQVNTPGHGVFAVNIALDAAQASNVRINSLTTDMPSYGANDNVNITVVLENTGDTDYNIMLEGSIIDGNNNIISFAQRQNTGTISLAAHATVSANLMWNTAKYTPTAYNIVIKVFNLESGTLLAQGSTVFTIRPDVLIGDISPLINPQFTNVKNTETINIRAQITNWSNVDTDISAVCEVKDTEGTVIFSASKNFTISAAEFSQTLDFGDFDYTFMKSGQYPVDITITAGAAPSIRGTASIFVAPSIRIEPTKKLTPDVVTPDGDKTIRIDIEIKGVEEMP